MFKPPFATGMAANLVSAKQTSITFRGDNSNRVTFPERVGL